MCAVASGSWTASVCGIGAPGRPASESGILCCVDGAHGRGHRRRRTFMLPTLKRGRQTGPMMNSIELSVRAKDLFDGSKGATLADALRRLALNADTKALTVQHRYYFQDSRLRSKLREREFADVLVRSAGDLLRPLQVVRRSGRQQPPLLRARKTINDLDWATAG